MFKRLPLYFYPAMAVFFGAAMFFFLYRLSGDSPKVVDMAFLIVSGTMLCLSVVGGLLEGLECKLNKWLEPKVGYAPQASAPIDPYPQQPHRYDLEKSLVHALAPYLVNFSKATDLGAYIREAADAILSGGLPGAKSICTCAQLENAACNNCPTIGAQADQRAEAEIVAAGLTAPRVTAEQIQSLMDQLTWSYEHEDGSRHTFAHAFLGDFYICTGHNAPVSRENFDAGLGRKYAREQAEGKARDKLWGLEGYVLAKLLKVVPS